MSNASNMVRARTEPRLLSICVRCYSAGTSPVSTAPPMLIKVRNDLKAAMKAKDSARLDVLRGLIAETTNAAKTSTPVLTDSHMLNLIRKRVRSSRGALADFDAAGRADLKDREAAQILVLENYVKDSNAMSEEDMARAIQDSIGKMRTAGLKMDKGSVMKALLSPGGALDGQLVDKKEVSGLVDGML